MDTRRLLRGAIAALAAIMLATSSAAAQSISIAIASEPSSLDPQAVDDGGERAVNDNIFDALMARDAEGNLVVGVAAEWPTQVDPTTWRFKLRDGVKFHDGSPLDAEAVAYSIKRMIDPALNSEQISYFSTIVGAEVVDPLTVDIKTSGPDPILPARMYYFLVVPPKLPADPKYATAPIGTGPYKFVEWVRGERIVLERNEDYWGGAPTVEKVTFRFISDADMRLSGLLAGELDIIVNLLPEMVDRVPQVRSVASVEHMIVIINTEGGPTKDKRVRQAMNYAVDKAAIAEALFEGYARVDDGQLAGPTYFGYDPQTKAYPYDLNKAKELIEAAGAEGQTINLVSTADRWLKVRELTEVLAASWEEAGLKVNAQIFDFSEYLKRVFNRETRPDSLVLGSSNELFDVDRSFSAYYAPTGGGASNKIARLQELIDGARTEIDVEKRRGMYQEAVRLAHEEAIMAWLINTNHIYGLSARIQWQPRADGKILVKTVEVTN